MAHSFWEFWYQVIWLHRFCELSGSILYKLKATYAVGQIQSKIDFNWLENERSLLQKFQNFYFGLAVQEEPKRSREESFISKVYFQPTFLRE